ncbi:MAG TPA: acVLRF1 family peptidyl-tRNA hydrolase [Marmoricola sp.]|nr:acVLRF1 family peptidyl-tRNA hydrolase [Marmoricola sp.]
MPIALVPRERLRRWLGNFEERHGSTTLSLAGGRLDGRADDGSTFAAAAPFGATLEEPSLDALEAACTPPPDWGVLLVRKGGFAVARLAGDQILESKVGQRHVQGRTKAGGQSQQRFARRRDNQARAAYEAAADHAARIVADAPVLVVGGDHGAIEAVLADQRLRSVAGRVVGEFRTVPDPRRGVLESAVRDACSVTIDVTNA